MRQQKKKIKSMIEDQLASGDNRLDVWHGLAALMRHLKQAIRNLDDRIDDIPQHVLQEKQLDLKKARRFIAKLIARATEPEPDDE